MIYRLDADSYVGNKQIHHMLDLFKGVLPTSQESWVGLTTYKWIPGISVYVMKHWKNEYEVGQLCFHPTPTLYIHHGIYTDGSEG